MIRSIMTTHVNGRIDDYFSREGMHWVNFDIAPGENAQLHFLSSISSHELVRIRIEDASTLKNEAYVTLFDRTSWRKILDELTFTLYDPDGKYLRGRMGVFNEKHTILENCRLRIEGKERMGINDEHLFLDVTFRPDSTMVRDRR